MPLNAIFKALADPTRRVILEMLLQKDLTAGQIAERFEMSKPSISHHLNQLKLAGLVQDERRGQHVVYSLNTKVLQDILTWIVPFDLKEGENTP